MTDITKLLQGIIVGVLAQALSFFQLQGQLKYTFLKDHYWITILIGIPISMCFMFSVKNLVLSFDGQLWPSRLIGFSIGAIVFSLLSYFMFNEPINLKTGICLGLAFLILIIQLFWK
jgi:multidrug transporter EmrE-like cation transporter